MDRGSAPLQRALRPKDQGCHNHGSLPRASAQDCHSLGSIAQGAFSMAPGTAFGAPSLLPGPTGGCEKYEPISAMRQGHILAFP